MREIKFRGWIKPFVNYKGVSVQGRIMCKVHSIHFGTKQVIITSRYSGNVSIPFENIILEEFTGLPDINGKDIYEGDIVRCAQGEGRGTACVEYAEGAFLLIPLTGRLLEKPIYENWLNDWDLEIIGNIHDNPELLEAPHDNA